MMGNGAGNRSARGTKKVIRPDGTEEEVPIDDDMDLISVDGRQMGRKEKKD
jgi:hypothetical protein